MDIKNLSEHQTLTKTRSLFLSFQLTAFVLVQSWLFLVVSSRFVDRDHRQALMNDLSRNLLNKNNSSPTLMMSLNYSSDDTDGHFIVRRSTRYCELRRTLKWNHCLGRRFTEVRCKRLSVTCLSRHNIPPKCKTNYQIIFREKRPCRVVKSCTCAA